MDITVNEVMELGSLFDDIMNGSSHTDRVNKMVSFYDKMWESNLKEMRRNASKVELQDIAKISKNEDNASDINKLLYFTIHFLPRFENEHIEIKKSAIHGIGLFAKTKINKDSLITFYPAHAIGKGTDKKRFMYSSGQFPINDSYKVTISDNLSIYGNNKNTENTLLLGHMINDSSYFTVYDINEDTAKNQIKNKVATYAVSSNNNSRIVHNANSIIPYVVATRDINENEEIFMSYSPFYWLGNSKNINIYEELLLDENFKQFMLKYYVGK